MPLSKKQFFVAIILCLLPFCHVHGQQPKLMYPSGPAFSINQLFYSPDGKQIVAREKGSAWVWESFSGRLIDSRSVSGEVDSIYYNEQGELSFKMTNLSAIRINPGPNDNLNSKAEDAVRRLASAIDTGKFANYAFSPDGRQLLTSHGGLIKVWNTASGRQLYTIAAPTKRVNIAALNNDATRIITVSNNMLYVWDMIKCEILFRHHFLSKYPPNAVFSPSGDKIVINNGIDYLIFETETGRVLLKIPRDHRFLSKRSSKPTFSPSGDKIIINEIEYKIFDANTGRVLLKTPGGQQITGERSTFGILGSNDTLTVLNSDSAKIYSRIKIEPRHLPNQVTYLPSSGQLILTETDKSLHIRDAGSGEVLFNIDNIKQKLYNPVKEELLWIDNDQSLYIWKPERKAAQIVAENVTSAICGATGKYLLVTTKNDSVTLLDAVTLGKKFTVSPTGVQENKVSGRVGKGYIGAISPDDRFLVLEQYDKCYVYSINGVFLYQYDVFPWSEIAISPDGNYIVAAKHDVFIRESSTGKLIQSVYGGTGQYEIKEAFFNNNGTKLIIISDGIRMKKSSSIVKSDNRIHFSDFQSLHGLYTDDGNKILYNNGDYEKVIDMLTGKEVYTFVLIDSTELLKRVPSGYYQATRQAAKQLHFVDAGKVITFDQLDLKYNRPDKVLEETGSTDTVLIKAYRRAYEKRLQKLGLDTSLFRSGYAVPDADFKNRYEISYEQKQRNLPLRITATDKQLYLARLNILVNGCPLYGVKGISLTEDRHDLDTVLTVALSNGYNRIEAVVTNTAGAENYRLPLEVTYLPNAADTAAARLYFIGIGVSRFKDSKANLRWSVKDIRNLAEAAKLHYTGNCVVDTLFDEDVSVQAVANLKEKLLRTGINDKVVIAYSGHGLLNDSLDYFLSTYNVDFNKPEKGGIPYEVFEGLLDGIPARQKLLLIDACHSGEIDKQTLAQIAGKSKTLAAANITAQTKGMRPKKNKIGIQDSFELMRHLFVDVGRNSGATVISAAAGTQFAYEKNSLGNGVFTHSLLEYFDKNKHAGIFNLHEYVSRRVAELTNGLQIPTTRSEPLVTDWALW